MKKSYTFTPKGHIFGNVTIFEDEIQSITFNHNNNAFINLKDGRIYDTDYKTADEIGGLFLNWSKRSDKLEDI